MRYYIRIGKSKADEWVNGLGTPAALAQNIFRLKKSRPGDACAESTYEVEGELDEAQAAAAHLLTDTHPRIEARHLVRIRAADLAAAGIGVEDSVIGTTGIVRVDFHHRDLVGTKEQFERPVQVILARLREGEDRIRRIGQVQLRYALEGFAGRTAKERPTHTLECINCMLEPSAAAGVRRDIVLARDELARISIPYETIRLRAFCLEEAGKGRGGPRENWLAAEEELQAEYAKHYLSKQLGWSE
jgi:hypothetical protein